jgi:hypothetical protein
MTRRQFFAAIPAAVAAWFGWRSKPNPDFVRLSGFVRFYGPFSYHVVWLTPEEMDAARSNVKTVLEHHKAEPWTYDFGGTDKFWTTHTPVKRGVADVRSAGK